MVCEAGVGSYRILVERSRLSSPESLGKIMFAELLAWVVSSRPRRGNLSHRMTQPTKCLLRLVDHRWPLEVILSILQSAVRPRMLGYETRIIKEYF